MTIDKKALDATQLEYLASAEALQAELLAQGFMATRIEKKADDRCTFLVIYFDGTRDYNISRNYRGDVNVSRLKWESYPNVSPSTRGDTWESR